jgi:hypothetical protein
MTDTHIVVIDADDVVCSRDFVDEIQGRKFPSHPSVVTALGLEGQEKCVHIYRLDDFIEKFNNDQVNGITSFLAHIQLEI